MKASCLTCVMRAVAAQTQTPAATTLLYRLLKSVALNISTQSIVHNVLYQIGAAASVPCCRTDLARVIAAGAYNILGVTT